MAKRKAIVLFSGGQDSTTCLYWTKYLLQIEPIALNIYYGQRHHREIDSARRIASMIGCELIEMDFSSLSKIGESAMFAGVGDVEDVRSDGLPATFVPGRNLFLLLVAAMYGVPRGVFDVVCGACQTDYSGYPDCRETALMIQQVALRVGMGEDRIRIHAPLMFLTKAETVQLARTFPGCWGALSESHTCYKGQFPPCRECPSCRLRRRGFEEAGFEDPLEERCGKK